MPPKILIRIPLTFSSDNIILNAAETFSLEAPPPTSRKLAGLDPYNFIISIVAIARPAPLTMHPIVPSSFIYDRPYLLASVSIGSSSFKSFKEIISGCRYKALSSKLILASRHIRSPLLVKTKGFISIRFASFSNRIL